MSYYCESAEEWVDSHDVELIFKTTGTVVKFPDGSLQLLKETDTSR